MKIGLIDIDSHNFPNLALMKLSRFHKDKGDEVEWVNYFERYDIVYKSKVFSFTNDVQTVIQANQIVSGGTGYDCTITLPDEVDRLCPDYSLYPKFIHAYGFLTRGCPNHCSWCIVPKKEGNIRQYMDISEFLDGRKSAILMDNNVLAHEFGIRQIEKIIKLGIRIDFNQGLDARLITDEIAQLLSKVKWIRYIRLACDHKSQIPHVRRAVDLIRKYSNTKPSFFVYVLVKDVQDALKRVEFCRQLKLDPFAQPYRDFISNKIDLEGKRFARWVNHKAIFKTVKWEEYK